jgi:hypothetical protein
LRALQRRLHRWIVHVYLTSQKHTRTHRHIALKS